MILKISKLAMAILHAKSMFSGSYSRLGKRNRKSQPAHRGIFLVDPHAEFEALGPRLTTLENHFVKNHFLINISNFIKSSKISFTKTDSIFGSVDQTLSYGQSVT